ncbi:MAG: hypothetical protein MJZ90_10335 [Bacteroidales bacterium]|nr:hypothetical protein [Bacteroidales bacterium]
MNYSINIDLKKIRGAFVKLIQGKTVEKKCICIPVENLYLGKNGAVYLDLSMVQLKKEGKYGDTHIVKEMLSSDEYNAMSDEERNSIPIIGNAKSQQYNNINNAAVEITDDEDLGF